MKNRLCEIAADDHDKRIENFQATFVGKKMSDIEDFREQSQKMETDLKALQKKARLYNKEVKRTKKIFNNLWKLCVLLNYQASTIFGG